MSVTNFSWDDLQLFLFVARGRGLADAARKTNVSAPTLSRRMDKFEKAMGVKYFERHARGYDLTLAGEALLKQAVDIEQSFYEIERGGRASRERERVRISCGSWLALYLCENFEAISEPEDDFLISLISTEKLVDISRREAVIGVRNSRPELPYLAARKLRKVEFAEYSGLGVGADVGWVAVNVDTPSAKWVRKNHGREICAEVLSPRNGLDLALKGVGKIMLPKFIGDGQVKLRQTGEVIEPLSHDSWMVLNDGERHQPATRTVIDRMVKLLK